MAEAEIAESSTSTVVKALADHRYGPVAGGGPDQMLLVAPEVAAQPELSSEPLETPARAQITVSRIAPDSPPPAATAPAPNVRAGIIPEVQDRGGHRNVIAAVMAGATVIAANWLRRRRKLVTAAPVRVEREGD
jgi:hypothetical protein